jgi:hypothetical protein
MKVVLSVLNFIRSQGFNRQFQKFFLSKTDAEYGDVCRMGELRGDAEIFLFCFGD